MKDVNEYIDQHRWLLNNGLITDSAKNNLYLYGAILNKSIYAVELSVNTDAKSLIYTLYVSKKLFTAYNRYNGLKLEKSILGLWRLKRLLKSNGNLEFEKMLSVFVKTYCGPNWQVQVHVKEKSEYEKDGPTYADDSAKDKQLVLK